MPFLDHHPALRAYLCLTTTAFCWGCNAVFARLLVGEASPMLVVAVRWAGAVLLMGIFAHRLIIRDWPKLRPHLPSLFAMGTLGFAVFNALFYVAAYTTSALNIGIIQGAIPVFVLLGALAIFRTPVTLLQWIGVALTLLGVCIVASGGDLQRLAEAEINRGDWLMILACLLYAGYALALRRFSGTPPLSLFAVIAFAALLASLPLAGFEALRGDLMWPSAKGWMVLGLVTLLPSFVAQICFIQGVSDIGPGRAGVFVNLVPVFAAFLAISILGEALNAYHVIALGLVVSGIWLAERKRKNGQKKGAG